MFTKCSCRDAWKDERLALLTQISDFQALIAQHIEVSARERAETLDRFVATLSPRAFDSLKNRSINKPTSAGPIWPGYRPELRPPSESSALPDATGDPDPELDSAFPPIAIANSTSTKY